MTAEFFHVSDQDREANRKLSECSERIAALLGKSQVEQQNEILACLDDLLGTVYSLFYATHHKYSNRPQTLSPPDVQAVLVRARDMAHCKIRTNGKWTAGYYFNSALFRLASVYHRTLQIVVGTQSESFKVLLRKTQVWFKSSHGSDWACGSLKKVNDEVNALKHTSHGIFMGRSVAFDDALLSVEELLTLLEAFQATGGTPISDPTREERTAAIEHVVYEYANLMSAAFYSLQGPAPMRTHSDDAFLLGYRKLGDFLMLDRRRYGDEILAVDFLPVQASRSWNLPTWEHEWRARMNKQLTHIAYARVRQPHSWDHRTWVPRLETEIREAWNNFLEAVSDREFFGRISTTSRLLSQQGWFCPNQTLI